MDRSNEAVNGGGGAIFYGNIQAGRDITINHVTEIRQVTEHLYNHCCDVKGVSENLLHRVDVLHGTAEFVEEYAKELQASLPPNDPQLQSVFRECASILFDLRRLVPLIEDNSCSNVADTTGFSPLSLNEEVIDVRFRLMSLQINLSHVYNKNMKQNVDADAIKRAIAELMNGPEDSEDTASIRTFYTASSIPYMERQMWREIERALRGRFTAEFVRDNYALIVDTVEETLWEDHIPVRGDTTTPALVAEMESAVANTTTPTSCAFDRSGTLSDVIGEGAGVTTKAAQTEQIPSDLPLAQHIPEMGEDRPSSSLTTLLNPYSFSSEAFICEDIHDSPMAFHTHDSFFSTSSATSPRLTRILLPRLPSVTFWKMINISLQDKNILKWSMYVIGVVWFDTQCDYNLVTSRFLRESCVEWQPYKNYSHSSIINGLVVNFLGEVQGRWHVVKSGNRDNLPPRYEITTFKVIDYPHTEVIIGRNTIEDLAMHTIFEELRPPRFNASTISRLLLRLRNRTK